MIPKLKYAGKRAVDLRRQSRTVPECASYVPGDPLDSVRPVQPKPSTGGIASVPQRKPLNESTLAAIIRTGRSPRRSILIQVRKM
jgi:hypothetical protein